MAELKVNVEVVVKHACKTFGEAPVWDVRKKVLLYVDMKVRKVFRYTPETGVNEMHEIEGEGSVSFILPCENDENSYLISVGRKICKLNWNTGEMTDFAEVPKLGVSDGLNDGKCDARGRVWSGTMGGRTADGVYIEDKGRLYCLHADGTLAESKECGIIQLSNGLAWTPDWKSMFFVDTIPRHVYKFDYDDDSGTLSNKRLFIDFSQWTIEEAGNPDGLTMDNEANLYVACFSAGKIIKFNSKTGEKLGFIAIPAKRTTSCTFGGEDNSELYVTSARAGVSEEEFKTSDPLAGSVFKVTGLGVKGVECVKFAG